MDHSINIRSYRKEDLPQIEALEARIQPYRPEAEAEVEAMYLRAECTAVERSTLDGFPHLREKDDGG